jgi:hypothetical protein
MEENNLPDILYQFLAAFSTLLAYCALNSTFISFGPGIPTGGI